MDGLTIKHDEELERAYDKWVLVRRSLGVTSFGMNTVELPPGEAIPEHDESGRDHEEVFLVLDGDAVVVVEGIDHPLRTGSFARLDPARLEADSRATLDGRTLTASEAVYNPDTGVVDLKGTVKLKFGKDAQTFRGEVK